MAEIKSPYNNKDNKNTFLKLNDQKTQIRFTKNLALNCPQKAKNG